MRLTPKTAKLNNEHDRARVFCVQVPVGAGDKVSYVWHKVRFVAQNILTLTDAYTDPTVCYQSNRVKMQAAMTMQNVAGLGLGVRARPTVRGRVTLSAKPSVFGAPVVGKSVKGFATRKAITPMAVADGAVPAGMKKVEVIPVAEGPFVGIMKDMKSRGPLYINDFMQGISFKSVVSFSMLCFFFFFFFPARPRRCELFFFFSLVGCGDWGLITKAFHVIHSRARLRLVPSPCF